MNTILKGAIIVLIIIIILILFHYRKYKNYEKEYNIEQQKLDLVKKRELYNYLNPLVIMFIEKGSLKDNVIKYHLYSPLSLNKNFTNIITNNNYLQHTNETLLIRSKNSIKVELINPKYIKFLKKDKKQDNLVKYNLEETNYDKVQGIDIIIREYNILLIPRFWLFKFERNDETIEVFQCDNVFTKFFNLLGI